MTIFSGESSEDLWNQIWKIHDKDTSDACYLLACKCQELETLVKKQQKLIEELLQANKQK